jgi:hypothetical protein
MSMNSRAAIEKGGMLRMKAIGKKRWAIPEGYIPSESISTDRALISHETACILNAGDKDAHVTLTIFFTNREPVRYTLTVKARRTVHLRFNDLKDPEPVPLDTDYSSVFESDMPITVQHTRLDSRRAEISLLTTIAYAQD